jgi:AcrR family transcriptional regulator
VPAADRRAERRIRLLDAGLDLLGTEGWAGTTVRGVCRRARLNPRYFYESFASLDDLAVAVYDRIVDRLGAEVQAAVLSAGAGRRARIRAAVDTIVVFVDDDPRRARVIYVEAQAHPALMRRRAAAGRLLVDWVARGARPGAAAPDDPVARLGAAVAVGGLNEALVAWLDGRIHVDRERFVDDTTILLLSLQDAAVGIARAGPTRTSGTEPSTGPTHEGETTP